MTMHRLIPNPDRKWWQVWKPRKIKVPAFRFAPNEAANLFATRPPE